MLTRSQFHRLCSPALLLFQLFGFATYASPPRSRRQCWRRGAYTASVAILLSAISVYALLTRITFHEIVGHVNVLSDQTVYLTILPAHLIALAEAWRQRHRTQLLFASVFDIARALHGAVDFERIHRRQVRANWLQLVGVIGMLVAGVMCSGWQSWLYFRWILAAEVVVNVRLMEVTMHVEVMAELLQALERSLQARRRQRRPDPDGCAVAVASEIYGHCHRLAAAISECFGYSVLAIAVYVMNGLVNTSFWFGYVLTTNVVKVYDEVSRVAFYIIVLMRLCQACTRCEHQRTRIAVALFDRRVAGDSDSHQVLGDRDAPCVTRDMGIQLLQQPIRVTVLGGIMVLNYAQLRSMLSVVLTFTIILTQFQQNEGKFIVLAGLY